MGVRWSGPGLADDVRSLLADRWRDGTAPPNLSAVLSTESGAMRGKHQLYAQGRLVTSAISDGALVRSLLRQMASLVSEADGAKLPLRASVVIDPGGRVILVDRRLARSLSRLDVRLRRTGYQVIDLPAVYVEPAEATVELPDVAAALGISAEAVAKCWPLSGSDDDLVSGPLRISQLVVASNLPDPSLAAAAAESTSMLARHEFSAETADVRALLRLLEQIEYASAASGDPGALKKELILS